MKVELRLVTTEEADARMSNEETCDVHTFGYWIHIPSRSGWHHGSTKQYWKRNCFYCKWVEETFERPDAETILSLYATATEIKDAIGITPDDVTEAKEAIRKTNEWSDTFPQEEGLYWFFGQDFGPKHEIIRLHTVKVHRIQNGYTYVCDGHFIYPSEAVGVWLPMTLPEFPKE